MFLPIYLATTAQEFPNFKELPSTLCYLACHFSAGGEGLSNLPSALPEHSILCADDSTPISNHKASIVIKQLNDLIERFNPCGILLDFQRPGNPYTPNMVENILMHLSCPVAVSHIYARDYSCPVFLPPLPFRKTISEYLSPWKGREIWLEIENDKEMAIVTEESFGVEQVCSIPNGIIQFRESSLLCHYCTQIKQDHIALFFHRTAQDLEELQMQAQKYGVTKFLGLWQQLRQFYSPR